MDPTIVAVFLVGIYMAWNMGANDVANSVSTSVGSRAITLKGAIVIVSILIPIGAIFFGKAVTKTIGKGIVRIDNLQDPNAVVLGAFAALLSAGLWLTIATWRGLPVSTTHSSVGGMLGFGLISGGAGEIQWGIMIKIVMSWVLSPLIGACTAYMLYTLLIKKFLLARKVQLKRMEKVFGYLQIASAMYVAFAFGSNDVANAIGPVYMLLSVKGQQAGVEPEVSTLLVIGAAGIVLGAATWGYRVIDTVGKRVTEITPTRGFSAEFAGASVILANSYLGLPISTTHTVVGSIIGVGLARGIKALNLDIIYRIVGSWILTVPITAVLSMAIYKMILSFAA
jgi:PiT family inorganic phosphate transporter